MKCLVLQADVTSSTAASVTTKEATAYLKSNNACIAVVSQVMEFSRHLW